MLGSRWNESDPDAFVGSDGIPRRKKGTKRKVPTASQMLTAELETTLRSYEPEPELHTEVETTEKQWERRRANGELVLASEVPEDGMWWHREGAVTMDAFSETRTARHSASRALMGDGVRESYL